MNDQPKPATGCTCNKENRGAAQHSSHCLAANRPPQPASGEWTALQVSNMGGVDVIAAAHNAVLVARDSLHRMDINQYVQQLAAEREKVQTLVDALKWLRKHEGLLQHQKVIDNALAKVK